MNVDEQVKVFALLIMKIATHCPRAGAEVDKQSIHYFGLKMENVLFQMDRTNIVVRFKITIPFITKLKSHGSGVIWFHNSTGPMS